MTGERYAPPIVPQPGGRPAAPGSLALVQEFLNTHYDLAGDGLELLGDPHDLASWLSDHRLLEPGVAVSGAQLQQALHVREGLRALALANNHGRPDPDLLATLNRAADGALVQIRLGLSGPSFQRASGGVPAALGLLLGLTAQAMLEGDWRRLKACPGEHCGWAFYDASRNQTGRWCSMSVCGGRAKARSYYRRRGGRAA